MSSTPPLSPLSPRNVQRSHLPVPVSRSSPLPPPRPSHSRASTYSSASGVSTGCSSPTPHEVPLPPSPPITPTKENFKSPPPRSTRLLRLQIPSPLKLTPPREAIPRALSPLRSESPLISSSGNLPAPVAQIPPPPLPATVTTTAAATSELNQPSSTLITLTTKELLIALHSSVTTIAALLNSLAETGTAIVQSLPMTKTGDRTTPHLVNFNLVAHVEGLKVSLKRKVKLVEAAVEAGDRCGVCGSCRVGGGKERCLEGVGMLERELEKAVARMKCWERRGTLVKRLMEKGRTKQAGLLAAALVIKAEEGKGR